MARKPRKLKVEVSPAAAEDLRLIYAYNLFSRGEAQATLYLAFLQGRMSTLSETYEKGKRIEGHPEYRYLLIKRHTKGDGHLAIYRVDEVVEILRVFHTKQNWEKLI